MSTDTCTWIQLTLTNITSPTGKFNASKYSCWDMCRAHVLIYESLMDDPLDQTCGFTHVGDGSGVTSAHIVSWNPTDFARLMKWGEVRNDPCGMNVFEDAKTCSTL